MATYSIGKIKTFLGREGHGLNAVILKDAKPICFVRDDANGGEVDFDFTNPGQNAKSFAQHRAKAGDEKTEFLIHARTWFLESGEAARWVEEMRALGDAAGAHGAEPSPQSIMESWVNHLVDAHVNKQRFDRLAKKMTIFRVEGDKSEEWRTMSTPYSPAVQVWLDKQYAGKVVAIWGVLGAGVSA